MHMKKKLKYFFPALASALLLTGCQDSVDIIISEAPIPTEQLPNEITTTNNSVTEHTIPIVTERTSAVTTSEAAETAVVPPRPSLEEELERYASFGADISFELIEETEKTVLAKKFIGELVKAHICAENTQWSNIIDLDEYIDNEYLKDYIEFRLEERSKMGEGENLNFKIPIIEAVERKHAGDIDYIKIKWIIQYYSQERNEWFDALGESWEGIRNGKIVDEGFYGGPNIYDFVGIEMDEVNSIGEPVYSFPPKRNPWDNIEDVKKVFDEFNIEMKEY